MGDGIGTKLDKSYHGPELWADRSSKTAKKIAVKVKCTAYKDGSLHCAPQIEPNKSDEYKRAYNRICKTFSCRSPLLVKEAPAHRVGPRQATLGTAAMGAMGVAALEWYELGTLAEMVGKGTSAIETFGVQTITKVPALALAGAAVFGPSQATWNREFGQLIQVAEDKEKSFDVTMSMTPEHGGAFSADMPTFSKASPPSGAGRSPKQPKKEPDNEHRTWKEIVTAWGKGIRNGWRGIRQPNRWQRFKEARRNNGEGSSSEPHSKIPKKPADQRWINWARHQFRQGTKEWWENLVKHWKGKFTNGGKELTELSEHPVRWSLDLLNRPTKFIKFIGNLLGLTSMITSFIRRVSNSQNTKPIGSELFHGNSAEIVEPVLGITEAASIGALLGHYGIGWGWGASFFFNGVYAGGSIFVQEETGGANLANIDWTRVNMNTVSGILWALMIIPYRISKAAFPGLKWGPYLAQLEERGHTFLANLLGRIPEALAPKRIPTAANFGTNILISYLYTYLIYPLNLWAEDADFSESYKSWSAKALSSNLFVKGFELSFDPYLRSGVGALFAVINNLQSIAFASYFQIYEGKKFYRKTFHDLAAKKVSTQRAYEQITKALAKKNFTDEYWELVATDNLDLFHDFNRGEFNPEEIEYFLSLIKATGLSKAQKRVKLALTATLYSYSTETIPFDWSDGSKDDEFARRLRYKKSLEKFFAAHSITNFSKLKTDSPKDFAALIEDINLGHYDQL